MNSKLFRTLVIIVTFFYVMPAMPQTTISQKLEKNFEKLYDKGIKGGRVSNGAYRTKYISDYEENIAFRNYLRERGFFTIQSDIVKGFVFIEDSLMEDYVCRKLTSYSYKDFTKNSYFHYNEWTIKNAWGYYTSSWGNFRRHKICWHGNVVDGNIEGKGIGFYREGDVFYIMTDGEFHHGFPIADVNVTQIQYESPRRSTYISEEIINVSLKKVIFDDLLQRGLHGSDPFTQKAVIAYYKDYYAGMTKEERTKLDEETFNNINNSLDVDFYIGTFPNGNHFQEVSKWLPNNYAGFRAHQQETIDKASDLTQTFIKEKVNGGSNLFELKTTKPSPDEISKIKNENERLLKRASFFATDIKKNLANDKNAQDKVQKFYDYMDILNGFYAINNSFDVRSCVEANLWGQVINPNSNTKFNLNSKGREIKSLFEKAGKTILKRIDEKHFEENDLLEQTYDYIYKYYSSFIKAVNSQLAMENKQHVREKLSSSSFKEYKFEGGQLVIELENGDIYRFQQSEGKWKYSSGNTAKVFPSAIGYNSIADAIEEAERMNRDYWNRGR